MFLKLFKMFNDFQNYNLVKVNLSFYNKVNLKSTEYFIQTLYMSVAVYLTSLALEVVAPIPFHWGVIITCSVCTFYTVLVSFDGFLRNIFFNLTFTYFSFRFLVYRQNYIFYILFSQFIIRIKASILYLDIRDHHLLKQL